MHFALQSASVGLPQTRDIITVPHTVQSRLLSGQSNNVEQLVKQEVISSENEWSELYHKVEGENPHNVEGWLNKLDCVASKLHPNASREYREPSLQRLLPR